MDSKIPEAIKMKRARLKKLSRDELPEAFILLNVGIK